MITITSLVNRHKNHLIQAQKKERKKKRVSSLSAMLAVGFYLNFLIHQFSSFQYFPNFPTLWPL